ncbi:outer membrane beta-barrel protein [Psychroserpens sp. BH13MA-6]
MSHNTSYALKLFITLVFTMSSYAQSNVFTISGSVSNKHNDMPIDGASVLILDLKGDVIISSTKTASDGSYDISFNKGNYHISYTSDGFESQIVPINYSEFDNDQKMEAQIALEPLTFTELEEVMIIAKDYRIENGRGKKIFHIGNSLKDVAGSMSNLLSYIPSVSVDIEGKVQLRGRTPIIKINGRTSNLSKSDALQMLPSDMVKKIEIIRSPSARDGETEPVINIITDRKRKGLIGGVNLAAGAPTTLKGGVHLAVNKEKFNGYGLYGVKREIDIKSNTNEFLENTINGVDYLETEKSNNLINRTNHFGEVQYEYLPNEQSELVGSASLYTDKNNVGYSGVRMIEENMILTESIDQISNNYLTNLSFIKEIEYELKLHEDKDLFKAEFEYEYEDKDKREMFTEDSSNQSESNSTNTNDSYKGDEMEVKLRYDQTLKNDAYLTIGYRLDRDVVKQNQFFEATGMTTLSLENDIKYTQYDNTGFVDYSNEYKGLYYSFGLRLKNTDRILEDRLTNEQTKRHFLNLLPVMNLSYEYGENSEISFNYYSILSQPRLSYLNSFNTSTDLQRVSVGNPELDPQLTHSLELEYFKEFENSTLTTTLYSNFTKDVIQYISIFDEDTNITVSMPENIGRARTYGLDFSYSLNKPRWLNTIIKVNGKYGAISNNDRDSDEFYALNTSFINIVRLDSYKLELSWFYNAPRKVNFQMREASNQYFKFGLSRRILKNKGNLVLSVIDPFNTGRRNQTISGTNFNYRSEYNPNQRRVFLSLFLRFSSKSRFRNTEKQQREKGILQ